jgi:hypothetical protein
MNASVLEAARHAVRVIAAWLEQQVDPEWQRAKTQHDRALCTVILDLLAQPDEIPSGTEWHCRVILPTSTAFPDEEWYEVTHWWEVYVRADGIRCEEYTNVATIIGAAQTYTLNARSTDEETDERQDQLAAWRAGLDEALQMHGVFVDAGRRLVEPPSDA